MIIDTKICFECGGNEHIHQHHIIPKSLGGTKTIPLCETCHGKVHQKDLVKFNNLAKEGIKRYVANGGKLGRKEGSSESIEKFMSKPMNIEIKQLVEQGHSVRKIVKMIGASSKTVVKVRKSESISTSTVVKVRKHMSLSKTKDPVLHTFF
jgi:transposase-like protein